MDTKKYSQRNNNKSRLIWFGIAIAVIVVWVIGFVPWWKFDAHGDAGSFGDSFGCISSLFSAFAFVGVIYTIWLQSRELGLQR